MVFDLLAISAGMFCSLGLFDGRCYPLPLAVVSYGCVVAGICAAMNGRRARIVGRVASFLAAGAHCWIQILAARLGIYIEIPGPLAIVSVPVIAVVLWSWVDWHTSENVSRIGSGFLRNAGRLLWGPGFIIFSACSLLSFFYVFTQGFTAATNVALLLQFGWYGSLAVAAGLIFWLNAGNGDDLGLWTILAKSTICAIACGITWAGVHSLNPANDDLWLAIALLVLTGISVVVISRSGIRIAEDKRVPVAV